MPERRASLLDFAIAAGLAVVPVLVAVILLVSSAQDGAAGRDEDDRHVSVRQLAALRTFEDAIVRAAAVPAPPTHVHALLDGVPACADEWRGASRWRKLTGRVPDEASSPAGRIVAQLGVVDRALARMSAEPNRRVAEAVRLDVARWLVAARAALDMPLASPRYPGRTFRVTCADLALATRVLARDDGRALQAFAWRGTEVARTVATWRDDQVVAIAGRTLARPNPWAGLPGCVYLAGDERRHLVAAPRSAAASACTQARVSPAATSPPLLPGEPGAQTPADDPRWQVPPSLHALLQPLDPLRRPSGALFVKHTGVDHRQAQRVAVDGAEVAIGYSVDLTIDPQAQALAQKVASCYTGRQDVCRALGLRREEDAGEDVGSRLLERAMVRMAAVAIVDVASGRIDALAGAMSPCARQEVDGPGRAAECDARLPYPIRYRPDALLNPAVHHDAMPASLVKPVLAAAFLSNAGVGERWLALERKAMARPPARESLRGELVRSDSARFLDRMFCADTGFGGCERAWEVQSVATAFGWNRHCDAASERCGVRDLMFGRDPGDAPRAPGAWVPFGRLLVEPDDRGAPGFRLRKPVALDTGRMTRCAAGPDGKRRTRDDWEKCRGGMIVDVVAEGWGQGHARTSAVGAAGMMATLAAAANGQSQVTRPHLVRAIRAVRDAEPPSLQADLASWRVGASEAHGLRREAAEVIVDALSYGHREGTSRRACEQVLGARSCREATWIAGKTGTPTFPNDERSLDDLARLCATGTRRTRDEQAACGTLRPYKWYAAVYRTDPSSTAWTKAIAVLTERNWIAATGRIHGAGDHGPNPAAEIAFQVASRHVGAPASTVAAR